MTGADWVKGPTDSVRSRVGWMGSREARRLSPLLFSPGGSRREGDISRSGEVGPQAETDSLRRKTLRSHFSWISLDTFISTLVFASLAARSPALPNWRHHGSSGEKRKDDHHRTFTRRPLGLTFNFSAATAVSEVRERAEKACFGSCV
ncbi:hypothetical protein BJ508DRAFT_155052 [Ascobolus immersus RN42]|uniref:Uncharacterized protein n=1 Tax=Ascobolus immersus RN42 TaxID=1160509 RepID=A0A3N4HXQ9_ASCIM|nr:hypothetical protein BJ508DRAFT_155052 [Ascobolus immersus RN42]